MAIKSTSALSASASPNNRSPCLGATAKPPRRQNKKLDDLDLLMEEAKTMLSVGNYHENIVNLQGITYEADFRRNILTEVDQYYTM